MIRYSTPMLTIELPDVDLTDEWAEIHVTFRQGSVAVDVDDPEIIDSHTMTVRLSQLQTAGFRARQELGVQVNLLTKDGNRIPSEIYIADVGDNLLKEVIGG